MKKKPQRMLAALLVLVLSISMLMGCGSSQSGEETGNNTAADSTDTADTDSTDTETTGEPEIDTEASLVIPVTADVVSLNMVQNCLVDTGLTMLGSLHDHLITLNADGSINYFLLENLEISEDGKVYTLTLNKNAKWHDGTPVTADDIIFTYDVLKEGRLDVGLGAALYIDDEEILYEKVDDYTVKLTLPRASNVYLSSLAMLYLMPKHVYENVEDMNNCDENFSGWGNGPYKYKEYVAGEKLVVERNEDYYRGVPSYKTIEYRVMPDITAQEVALLNGEIDYFRVESAETLAKYENDDNFEVHTFVEGRINYLQLNKHSTALEDVKAREALVKALNIDEIVAGAFGSDKLATAACGTVICAGEIYYNEDVANYQQDVETAKKLAEETGLTEKPIKLIYNNNRASMESVALIIQQQLKNVGITCEVEGLDSNAFFALYFFDDTQDAWDIGLNGWASGGRANYCSWYIDGSYYALNCHTSEELNELWTAADQATENVAEAYNEVSRLLQTYYTYVPITNTNRVVITPANAKGWEDSSRQDLSDYMTLYKTK